MGFVYQPEREGLLKSVRRNAHYLTGRCIDIGVRGKEGRYREELTSVSSYKTLDLTDEFEPDLVANAEDMGIIPDGSFDSILCTEVLICVHQPEKAIAEFNRILTKGGQVLITTPFLNPYLGEIDYWRFTPESLKFLLERNGFEVIVSEKIAVGVFIVVNQLINRFIKISFNLQNKGLTRRIWNKLFIFGAELSKFFDWLFESKANGQFFLDVTVVARKL